MTLKETHLKRLTLLLCLLPSLALAADPPKPAPAPPAVAAPAPVTPPVTNLVLPNGTVTNSADVFAVLNQQKQAIEQLQRQLNELQGRFWQLFDFLIASGRTPPSSAAKP